MATKPPAKAAPKSAGKAATKPAAKSTPVKKPVAKPAVKKPDTKVLSPLQDKAVPDSGYDGNPADDRAPWEEDAYTPADAEQQLALDSLTAMMSAARLDITPQDTERLDPAPVVPKPPPKYEEAVKVDYSPRPTPSGSLRMSDIRSALTREQNRQPSTMIGNRFKLR